MKLSSIRPNPANPRTIRDDKFSKLKASLEQFPKMMALRPIVVDDAGMVLGGNMRLLALQELGYNEVPEEWVKQASELTEGEKRRFVITDNAGFGEWDWDMLANEWDAGELAEWGLDVPEGWGDDVKAEEDDYTEPKNLPVDVVTGDLIEIGRHRLLCGDSTNVDDVDRLMGGDKARLMITDPPYGVEYVGGTSQALTINNDALTERETHQLWRDALYAAFQSLLPGASIYATAPPGPLHVGFAGAMKDLDLLRQIMVWVKDSLVLGHSDYHYMHEPILYGWKPGASHEFFGDRTNTTVFEISRPKASREHPTMKPVELWAEFISNSSKQWWLVYDPFIGSGTTMVAAHQLNRVCYGMEIDPKYCQVIIDRMHKLDPGLEVKINGKKYQPRTEEEIPM